jgi:hypothetical protein
MGEVFLNNRNNENDTNGEEIYVDGGWLAQLLDSCHLLKFRCC